MLIEQHTFAHQLAPAAIDTLPSTLPVAAARAQLGFPSPAEDFQDDEIDLGTLLVRNPSASYLYVASGWSMIHAGIAD